MWGCAGVQGGGWPTAGAAPVTPPASQTSGGRGCSLPTTPLACARARRGSASFSVAAAAHKGVPQRRAPTRALRRAPLRRHVPADRVGFPRRRYRVRCTPPARALSPYPFFPHPDATAAYFIGAARSHRSRRRSSPPSIDRCGRPFRRSARSPRRALSTSVEAGVPAVSPP